MKSPLACVAGCAAVLAAAACGNDPSPGQAEAAAGAQIGAPAPAVPAGLARVDFHVAGMTCGGCETGTRAALKKVDGVRDAGASYASSSAWAVYDPAKASPEQMMAAIRELGYRPSVLQAGGPARPAS